MGIECVREYFMRVCVNAKVKKTNLILVFFSLVVPWMAVAVAISIAQKFLIFVRHCDVFMKFPELMCSGRGATAQTEFHRTIKIAINLFLEDISRWSTMPEMHSSD